MSDFLPIRIDTDSVEIQQEGNGWCIVINSINYGELYARQDPVDPLYDMLHDKGVLTVEDGDVVQTGDNTQAGDEDE